MGTPILHVALRHRNLNLAPYFPSPAWALSSTSSLDRTGDTVTLGLMARPLDGSAELSGALPDWARPAAPAFVELTVPSTGTVVARILINTTGGLLLYGASASGSWAYASVSWRALVPW